MKSLGPGRALEEPISGDVGDVLRYWVYHGLPHDSGDPLFGGSESRLPSPFVCFSLQLIETWFLVHVTFFHGSLTLCGELWMPTKRTLGMDGIGGSTTNESKSVLNDDRASCSDLFSLCR